MSKDKLSKAKYNSLLKMQKNDPMKILTDQNQEQELVDVSR